MYCVCMDHLLSPDYAVEKFIGMFSGGDYFWKDVETGDVYCEDARGLARRIDFSRSENTDRAGIVFDRERLSPVAFSRIGDYLQGIRDFEANRLKGVISC